MRRDLLKGALAAPVALLSARPALAQAYPTKSIRLVIPSGAGGGSDIFARPMAEFMSKELGQQVLVENKPGANGIVAHETVVRQPADGYTLVISYSAAMIANKLLLSKMSHDPLKDFVPIAQIGGGGGNVLVVTNDAPIKNVRELLDYAKGKNGAATYGSWGIASGGHLVMEMIKTRTGMQITHVPYKTVAQMPPDIISGVMQIAWIDAATPVPHIKNGRMRAIAVAAPARLPLLPDVPTLTEQGIEFNVSPCYGLYAPVGTPKPVVDRLNAVINKWVSIPEWIAYFEQKQNWPKPPVKTAEEFSRYQDGEVRLWKQLVEESRVKLEG